LPSNWKSGDVSGLVGRNGFVLSMYWDNNLLTKGSVHSKLGQLCKLRTKVPLIIKGVNVASKKINTKLGVQYLTEFQTEKNKIYNFESQNRM
jgi:alpha-L-fucosidase 2